MRGIKGETENELCVRCRRHNEKPQFIVIHGQHTAGRSCKWGQATKVRIFGQYTRALDTWRHSGQEAKEVQ